jgi:BMFP domain-containing protein YqiC
MRYASARELAAIEARLAALESRLDNLEAAIRARSEQSNPRPHG